MALETRQLGRNGPLVPALGFGLMNLSNFGYDQATPVGNDEDRFKVLDRAVELGATFWDTSDIYKDSEDLLCGWFQRTGKRDQIFLADKFGYTGSLESGMIIRTDPEYVREACEKSLKRLGVKKIDLWYAHRVDLETPIEKTVEVMAELKKEGKIDYLGLSEVSSSTLRRAHAVDPITAVQIEYSPFSLEAESEQIGLLQTCRELGVALVAYSPLGRGMLTGRYKSPSDFEEGDSRHYMPRFSAENFSKNLDLVEKISWELAQGMDIFPIPGTKSAKNLEENMEALSVRLTEVETAEIRLAIDATGSHGERMPAGYTADLYADTPELESSQ